MVTVPARDLSRDHRKLLLRITTSPDAPTPSRPAHLRQANARHLLRLIQSHNPCSRADLVRYSGLSAPTITSCVVLLESLNLVEVIGDGQSNGGRPPVMLRFNAQHSYVAAADVGGTRLRMMLADLSGTPLTQWSHVLEQSQKTPSGVCSLVREGVKEMCEASGVPRSRVLHLTAGAPGITDVNEGTVRSAPNLTDWNDVPLRSLLTSKLGMEVIVENDTNLAAVGEYRYGAAHRARDFVFLAIGTGAGAGIFINGRLHHGATWSAGEVGYFGVGGKAREPMRMRDAGQLERVIGGGGIEALWQDLLRRQKVKLTAGEVQLRASQILDLAMEGHRIAQEAAQRTAALIADAIADIALLLNPEVVILGGGVGSHPELCRLTCSAIKRHELASGLDIQPSALGTQAQLRGAVALSLEAMHAVLLPGA